MNATFYIGDPSLIDSKLFKRFPEVMQMEGVGTKRKATGFVLTTRWGSITFNFMPEQKVKQHLDQFGDFIRRAIPNADDQVHALNRLAYVRLCMSCTFDTELGKESEIGTFLVKLNRRLNGLLFVPEGLIDHDGARLWKAK